MANKDNSVSVKIRKVIFERVKENKKITGVPIATFFEKAAEEKLILESKKNR